MLVVDTSVLLAAADNADPDHDSCTRVIESARPLITTPLVIAETSYLIRRQLGAKAEAAFFRALAAEEIQVEPVTPMDARRIADLIETYSDLGLSGTDAILIVLTERLNTTVIATLDRRHFGVVRPHTSPPSS